jgi:hypothetical protein
MMDMSCDLCEVRDELLYIIYPNVTLSRCKRENERSGSANVQGPVGTAPF